MSQRTRDELQDALLREMAAQQNRRLNVSAKKTMTLNMTEREMQVLEELCAEKDMSKTAIMRQALRLYQAIDRRLKDGDQIFKSNTMVILP